MHKGNNGPAGDAGPVKRKHPASPPRPGAVPGSDLAAAEPDPDIADLSDPLALFDVSPRMRALSEVIRQVARTDATVLILGESGVGKNVIARALHAAPVRRSGPFVLTNCAALPAELLESELFGHEKGPSPGPIVASPVASSLRPAERCAWTRSGRCRHPCSRSFCTSCRIVS